MIITSKDPKHLSLGRDIEKTTLRMAHLKRVMDLSQQAFRSALEVYGSFRTEGPDGKPGELEGVALDHLIQIKSILSNLQGATEESGAEFDNYVQEYSNLETALFKLEKRQPKPNPTSETEMKVETPLTESPLTPVPPAAQPDSV